MLDRRQMLGAMSLPALAASARLEASPLLRALPPDRGGEQDYWSRIAGAFTVDRSLVNLNNGGVSPSPAYVQDAMKRHLDYSNEAPAYTMWRVLEPQREAVRDRMALEWGVDPEEVAFTRNASEGLQICQFGFDLQPGDEVLTTDQDYPRMITTFEQRQRREGIVLRQFSLPTPCEDPDEIVRLFERHVSEKTRLILMCHVINLTGQVLPVRAVCDMARRRGIPVIVDGAHALAHLDFKIPDLGCDYYATSLHKWLFAPHGTGLLYVRREKIPGLWPLMAAGETLDADIRKFEQIGTHPAANYLAIAEALTFHQGIGAERKLSRLIELRDRWAGRLLENERVHLNTSLAAGFAGGIANVRVEGLDSKELTSWLWKEHRILTVAIEHEDFEGVRVSPSVYTTFEELDRFCDAVERAIRDGLPA